MFQLSVVIMLILGGGVLGSFVAYVLLRSRGAAALRESKERFRAIFETAEDSIFIKDRSLRYTQVNRAMERLFELPASELVGRTDAELFDAEAGAHIREADSRVFGGETIKDENTKLVKGVERTFHTVKTPMRDASGAIIGLCGIARDITERKQAVEALRESEEKLRSIVENSTSIFYSHGLDHVLTYLSPRSTEILDCKPEDAMTRWTEFATDAPINEVGYQLTQKAIDTGRRQEPYELELITPKGRIVWAEVRESPIVEDGKTVAIVGSLTDITERKRAEAELRFRAMVLDSISDQVTATDLAGRIAYVNQATCMSVGKSREELIGELVAVYGEDPDEGAAQREIVEATREKGEWHGEVINFTSSGKRVVVETRTWLLRDENGEPTGMCGTSRDITERKRAEAERVRLMSAIEQAAETIIITDAGATIRYVNPAFERITGYAREEAIGQNPRIVKSGEHDDAFYKEMWDTLMRGETWSGRLVNKKKDGTLFTEVATISPVRDASGKTVNYVSTRRDITEEIKLEDQLRQAQKMEAVGQLAGGVAHDFNNILTAILGNVELSLESMRSELGANHDVVASMEQIEEAALRASALTRQLLTFSRRGVTQPANLNLNDILANTDRMLRRLITENIAIETVTDPDLKLVRADAGQVEQVIANLVVNAVHAMPDGGRLTLETRNVTLDEDYANSHAKARAGRHVLLAVRDTGHGMDAETLDRIFEPFFTTKPVDKGTGLGLATVHGIVKQSGGHITVHSEPERGTTFNIYLPAIEAAPAEDTSVSQLDASWRGHETILLCEDDRPVCKLTAGALRAVGYTVIIAGNGQEGIEAAENHAGAIDLLITDVIMPDMNGRALSERLGALRPGLPTLFISGYTSDVIAHHGSLDEGVEFLDKPFTGPGLLAKVRTVLDKTRSDA